jgi:hypothetical protein
MEYTLYRIVDRKVDYDRVVMHMTDMNGMYMDRFWDFGAVSVFDVAKILGVWEEKSFKTDSISKTDFIKKFGRKVVAF